MSAAKEVDTLNEKIAALADFKSNLDGRITAIGGVAIILSVVLPLIVGIILHFWK